MKKAQMQAAYQRKLVNFHCYFVITWLIPHEQIMLKNRRAEVKKMWVQVNAIKDKATAIAEFKAKNNV